MNTQENKNNINSYSATKNILAYIGVISFFAMLGYIIVRGLGNMTSDEAFLVGSLTGTSGAIAKDIYGYYFGSSVETEDKNATIKKELNNLNNINKRKKTIEIPKG